MILTAAWRDQYGAPTGLGQCSLKNEEGIFKVHEDTIASVLANILSNGFYKFSAKLLDARLSPMLTNEEDLDIEKTNQQIIKAMKEAENKCKQSLGVRKKEKLSDSSKKLMKKKSNSHTSEQCYSAKVNQQINIKIYPERCKASQKKEK